MPCNKQTPAMIVVCPQHATSASTPSTSAKAPQNRTSTVRVMNGQTMARMPNKIATTPRSANGPPMPRGYLVAYEHADAPPVSCVPLLRRSHRHPVSVGTAEYEKCRGRGRGLRTED